MAQRDSTAAPSAQRVGRSFALGTALGALTAFFFDPQQGRRRRHQLVSRTGGMTRRTIRRGGRARRGVNAEIYGLVQKATHLRERPKDFDDVTLARKVETEIFRSPDVPKGQINVNAEDGVVYLRGEAPTPELIDDLVRQTRKVHGVRDVRNLLHLPKTEARMKE